MTVINYRLYRQCLLFQEDEEKKKNNNNNNSIEFNRVFDFVAAHKQRLHSADSQPPRPYFRSHNLISHFSFLSISPISSPGCYLTSIQQTCTTRASSLPGPLAQALAAFQFKPRLNLSQSIHHPTSDNLRQITESWSTSHSQESTSTQQKSPHPPSSSTTTSSPLTSKSAIQPSPSPPPTAASTPAHPQAQ